MSVTRVLYLRKPWNQLSISSKSRVCDFVLAWLALEGERILLTMPRREGRRLWRVERDSSLLLDVDAVLGERRPSGAMNCESVSDNDFFLLDIERRIQDGDSLSMGEEGSVDIISSDMNMTGQSLSRWVAVSGQWAVVAQRLVMCRVESMEPWALTVTTGPFCLAVSVGMLPLWTAPLQGVSSHMSGG